MAVATAVLVTIDAYIHFHDADFYDLAGTSTLSEGNRFRAQAAAAVAVRIALIVRPRPVMWAVAVLVTASAVGAAQLSVYVDVGTLGPLPDLYKPTWAVPGKSSSGVAEGIATFLAIIGFVMAVGGPSIGGAACPGLTAVAASPPARAHAATLARAGRGIQATGGMTNIAEHT